MGIQNEPTFLVCNEQDCRLKLIQYTMSHWWYQIFTCRSRSNHIGVETYIFCLYEYTLPECHNSKGSWLFINEYLIHQNIRGKV